MSNEDARQDVYQKLLYEHQQLQGLLKELKQTISERAESMEDIAAKFSSLLQHLQEHFQAEEDNGYFMEVVRQAPHVADRVAALEAQHVQLLVRVREVTRLAEQCSEDPTGEDWEELTSGFQVFSIALTRHESRENQLLQEVFIQDIGSHD